MKKTDCTVKALAAVTINLMEFIYLLFICLSIYLFVYLFIYLFTYLFTYLSIYLFVY